AVAVGRWILHGLYLHACRSRLALDDHKLVYYQALAVLRRLARYGRCLGAGPQVLGVKPALTRHLRREHLEVWCRHFRRLTGVGVHLEADVCAVRPTEAVLR